MQISLRPCLNMFALSIWYCAPIIEEHVTDKPGFLVVLQSAHA